jgi:transposase-like protein
VLSSLPWQYVCIWFKNRGYAVTDVNIYPPVIHSVIYRQRQSKRGMTLRKRLKSRGVFPNDESIVKLLYVVRHSVTRRWPRAMRNGKQHCISL